MCAFSCRQHAEEVRTLLHRIRNLEQELEESRIIARDSATEVAALRKRAEEAEQLAENAVTAQSVLQGVESKKRQRMFLVPVTFASVVSRMGGVLLAQSSANVRE